MSAISALAPLAKDTAALKPLVQALSVGTVRWARVLEFNASEALTSQTLRAMAKKRGSVLMVLSQALAAQSAGQETPLPPGYVFTDLDKTAASLTLLTPEPKVRLLELGKADFDRVLAGEADFKKFVEEAVRKAHPVLPMFETVREHIRSVRKQNILALVTRGAIALVNNKGGLREILNPEDLDVQSPLDVRYAERRSSTNQQVWAITKGLATLKSCFGKERLIELAHESRAAAVALNFKKEADTAGLALHIFRLKARQLEEDLLSRKLPELKKSLEQLPYEEEARSKLLGRLLEIAWLGTRLEHAKKSTNGNNGALKLERWERLLTAYLRDASAGNQPYETVLRSLDARVERFFNALTKEDDLGILSIAFKRHLATPASKTPGGSPVPRSDTNYKALLDLRKRLLEGEVSSVGGSAYAAMRFPDEVLDNVAAGKVPAVVFNGYHEDGVRYVRHQFGRSALNGAVLEPCLEVNLQGAYGSFKRSWVFFADGRSVVLVSHPGKARQLSNAGAFVLYRNGDRDRVPMKNLLLVDGPQNMERELRWDLAAVLKQSELQAEGQQILGEKISKARELPTALLILLHPKQLKETLQEALHISEYRTRTLGPVQVAYLRTAGGQLTRLIIPTVGGAGLYGETAGIFLKTAFDPHLIPNLMPHVLFSATAGGFAETEDLPEFLQAGVKGLKKLRADGFLMPLKEVHDELGAVPMTTLLAEAQQKPACSAEFESFKAVLEQGFVHKLDRHYCVSHPGDETYKKTERLVRERLVSSIDVEAGPCQRAILEIRRSNPEATLTILDNWSDDPRSGKADNAKTLAYGGPLHDNWQPDLRLNGIVLKWLDLALACHRNKRARAL